MVVGGPLAIPCFPALWLKWPISDLIISIPEIYIVQRYLEFTTIGKEKRGWRKRKEKRGQHTEKAPLCESCTFSLLHYSFCTAHDKVHGKRRWPTVLSKKTLPLKWLTSLISSSAFCLLHYITLYIRHALGQSCSFVYPLDLVFLTLRADFLCMILQKKEQEIVGPT